MSKFKKQFNISKINSKRYNEVIEIFITKFNNSFPNYMSKEEIKKILNKNIKKIYETKDEEATNFRLPLIGVSRGLYHRVYKSLMYAGFDEETVYHELLHALTAQQTKKRYPISKIILADILKIKRLSPRQMEEGMTEFFSSEMLEDTKDTIFEYAHETNMINKLSKIYGYEIILDYYTGKNKELIKKMGTDNFKKFNQLIIKAGENDNVPQPFNNTAYLIKKKEIFDAFLLDLMKKENFKKENDIQSVENNLHYLIEFYQVDIEMSNYELLDINEKIKNTTDPQKLERLNYLKNKAIEKFKVLENQIIEEWNKTGIKDKKQLIEIINKQNKKEVVLNYITIEQDKDSSLELIEDIRKDEIKKLKDQKEILIKTVEENRNLVEKTGLHI